MRPPEAQQKSAVEEVSDADFNKSRKISRRPREKKGKSLLRLFSSVHAH